METDRLNPENLPNNDLDELIIGFFFTDEILPGHPKDGAITLDHIDEDTEVRYRAAISHLLDHHWLIMEQGVSDHLQSLITADPRLIDYALDIETFQSGAQLVRLLTSFEYYMVTPIEELTLGEYLRNAPWFDTADKLAKNGHGLGAYIDRPLDSTRLYQVVDEHGIPIPGKFFWTSPGGTSGRIIKPLGHCWEGIEDASAAIGKRHPHAQNLA